MTITYMDENWQHEKYDIEEEDSTKKQTNETNLSFSSML
jgi:hypothetical protein